MTVPAPSGGLGRGLAIVASVVALATIVASVVVTGTPSVQREIRLDARRVSDLVDLEDAVQRHFRDQGALPSSLAVLADKPGVSLAIIDPVTGVPYDFEPTGPRAYRLCATFTTDTGVTREAAGYGASASDWAHGRGRRCFDRKTTANDE